MAFESRRLVYFRCQSQNRHIPMEIYIRNRIIFRPNTDIFRDIRRAQVFYIRMVNVRLRMLLNKRSTAPYARVENYIYTQYNETQYLWPIRGFKMKWMILSLLAVATACPARHTALKCFYKVVDTNSDGKVSHKELIVGIDTHLPWWKRTAFHMFGGVDKIFKDCDANEDGFLTIDDAEQRPDACMETCFKRQATIDTFKC